MNAAMMDILIASHHVVVTNMSPQAKRIVESFCMEYAERNYVPKYDGSVDVRLVRVYASRTKDRSEFRFHINQYPKLLEFFKYQGFGIESFNVSYRPMFKPKRNKIQEKFQPRKSQPLVINHLTSPGKQKVVTLQTGGGKTFCALYAASKVGSRIVISVSGMYVEVWLAALFGSKSVVKIKQKDIMVVRGGKALAALIELALNDEIEQSVIIITQGTLRQFIDHYEQYNREMMYYQCRPDELYELLGAGIRLIDEVHEDFHFNFRQDLYTHIESTWSLTATLKSDNRMTDRMYNEVFMADSKMPEIEYSKYAHLTALNYGLTDLKSVRTSERGSFMYSHNAYERSILANKKLLAKYLDMIRSIVYEIYITKMKPGQRLLIYAATVAMCEAIQKDLGATYDLVVGKYTSDDDYSVLQTSDIAVSTLQSAGTGVDIDGLCYVLMTNSVKSIQSNLQAFGRLRDIRDKWPGTELHFYYLVCRDIPKHLEYDFRKREIFSNKALSHRSLDTPHRL